MLSNDYFYPTSPSIDWKEVNCNYYYYVLLNIALLLYLGLLRPRVSGMTLCRPFNPHCDELSYVLRSYC